MISISKPCIPIPNDLEEQYKKILNEEAFRLSRKLNKKFDEKTLNEIYTKTVLMVDSVFQPIHKGKISLLELKSFVLNEYKEKDENYYLTKTLYRDVPLSKECLEKDFIHLILNAFQTQAVLALIGYNTEFEV